jgi:hypothetical protein
MNILVGSTGLVGQTVQKFKNFDLVFNSKNITQFEEIVPDNTNIFLTCLPATKWLVNKNLSCDMDNINNIIKTLNKKQYSKITLISTIDVYNDSPLGMDENYNPNVSKLSYGNNRYIFELMVKEYLKTDNLKIFRLPALFNNLIKKNILFDLINNNNINQININSAYQWYDLDMLVGDIEKYSQDYPEEQIFNLFTEPIETDLIVDLFPQHKNNVIFKNRIEYNYKTKFGGYIDTKDNMLKKINKFKNEFSIK